MHAELRDLVLLMAVDHPQVDRGTQVGPAVAAAVVTPPAAVRYRSPEGDALLPAVLRGEVAVAVTGLAETAAQVDAGTVRARAVSSAARSLRVAAPTLREAGLDVTFTNWRGLLGAPGLSDDDRTSLLDLVVTARSPPAWRAAVVRNGRTEAPLEGEAFGAFLVEQRAQVAAAPASR